MELTLARDYGDGVDLTLSGRIEELLPSALAQPRAFISIESAPSLEVPLGFRYLYAAPASSRVSQASEKRTAEARTPEGDMGETSAVGERVPLGEAEEKPRTLVVLGMNPNTAANAREGKLADDATTRDIRALAANPLTAPGEHPFTRVLFLTMGPFRGIINKGGLAIADALADFASYEAQHTVNMHLIPAVLESVLLDEGCLDILAMWGTTGDKASGRFALPGVRDLRHALLALADQESVRWYNFGLTSAGAPRNYAGLRYLKGMSVVQKALRTFTLTPQILQAFHCESAWLSLNDSRARMDRATLEGALRLPKGVASRS